MVASVFNHAGIPTDVGTLAARSDPFPREG